MSDSLKDSISNHNDSELKNKIESKYYNRLNSQKLMGEELGDLKEVSTGYRKYDYGQASDSTVTQKGIKIEFNPDKTELKNVQEGGKIQNELRKLCNKYLHEQSVELIELSFVTDESYTVWIIYE